MLTAEKIMKLGISPGGGCNKSEDHFSLLFSRVPKLRSGSEKQILKYEAKEEKPNYFPFPTKCRATATHGGNFLQSKQIFEKSSLNRLNKLTRKKLRL